MGLRTSTPGAPESSPVCSSSLIQLLVVGDYDCNLFVSDGAEIPGEIAATGTAAAAMRSGARVSFSWIPEAFREDSRVGVSVRAPRVTRVLRVYRGSD